MLILQYKYLYLLVWPNIVIINNLTGTYLISAVQQCKHIIYPLCNNPLIKWQAMNVDSTQRLMASHPIKLFKKLLVCSFNFNPGAE